MHSVLLALVAAVFVFLVVGASRALVAQYRQQPRVLQYHLLHLGMWAGAIFSLSGCFATWRRLSGEQPNIHPVLNLLLGTVYGGVLVVSFLALGFFMYREDSRKGIIKRRFSLYERLLTQES